MENWNRLWKRNLLNGTFLTNPFLIISTSIIFSYPTVDRNPLGQIPNRISQQWTTLFDENNREKVFIHAHTTRTKLYCRVFAEIIAFFRKNTWDEATSNEKSSKTFGLSVFSSSPSSSKSSLFSNFFFEQSFARPNFRSKSFSPLCSIFATLCSLKLITK